MGTALMFAETVFYFTVSAAVIVLGALGAVIAYHLIRIIREFGELFRDLHRAGSVAGERMNDIIDRLSNLPILSYLLKKRPATSGKKGRGKLSKSAEQ